MNMLEWLMNWYESNCDGAWEHYHNNVTISTLDNPGWRLQLNLMETLYENVDFNDVWVERTDNDWVFCKKNDGIIDGAGGPKNLEEMIGIIKKWMDDNKPTH